MKRGPLFYWILFAGGLCLMVSVWIHRNSDKSVPEGFNRGDEHTSESRQRGSERANRQQAEAGSASMSEHTRGSHDVSSWENGGGNSTRARPPIPGDKGERIQALYDNLTEADWEGLNRWGPHPKEFEILTEGMDAFSAAKYINALGHPNYARKYIEWAFAENPESFEVLLLWTRSRLGAESEAGYRKLLEMNPNSVEVLAELGGLLCDQHPEEAIVYLKKANQLDPQGQVGLTSLGFSYQRLGEYDKALAAFKKRYEFNRSPLVMGQILAIESGNPLIKPLQHEPQKQLPIETPPEVPSQEEVPAIPNTPDGLKGETNFDESLGDFTPPSENPAATAAEQQGIEEFLRMLEAIEQTIPGESSSPLNPTQRVEEQIADLERFIKTRPNRAEGYLELAQAYKDAGDDEKAAAVYRRARKRFPNDEEVRRESEAYRERRERSAERDEYDDDSYSDQDER